MKKRFILPVLFLALLPQHAILGVEQNTRGAQAIQQSSMDTSTTNKVYIASLALLMLLGGSMGAILGKYAVPFGAATFLSGSIFAIEAKAREKNYTNDLFTILHYYKANYKEFIIEATFGSVFFLLVVPIIACLENSIRHHPKSSGDSAASAAP